jgi:energy-coupling factor transport system substrate-specific component
MEETYTALEKGNRWSVKDITLTVIFSVLAIAILVAVNFITMFNTTLNLVFAMGIIVFLISPLYVFVSTRVNKRFVTTVFFVIYLIYIFFTTWYNGLLFVATLMVVEAFMWKKDSYKSLWKNTVAYSLVGAAAVSMSFTTFAFWEDYQSMALQSGMPQEYLDAFWATYTDPVLVIGVYAFTIACCVAGCLLSRAVLKKHFDKAGVY